MHAQAMLQSATAAGIPMTPQVPEGSERLSFRPLNSFDIFWLSALISRPQVRALMLATRGGGLQEAGEIIQAAQYLQKRGEGLGFWVALHQRAMIGVFSLIPGDPPNRIEMGVQLHPNYWAKWLGVEGGHLLSRYAFQNLGLQQVYAHVHPENFAARAISVRVGFADLGDASYFSHPAKRLELTRARFEALEATRQMRRSS